MSCNLNLGLDVGECQPLWMALGQQLELKKTCFATAKTRIPNPGWKTTSFTKQLTLCTWLESIRRILTLSRAYVLQPCLGCYKRTPFFSWLPLKKKPRKLAIGGTFTAPEKELETSTTSTLLKPCKVISEATCGLKSPTAGMDQSTAQQPSRKPILLFLTSSRVSSLVETWKSTLRQKEGKKLYVSSFLCSYVDRCTDAMSGFAAGVTSKIPMDADCTPDSNNNPAPTYPSNDSCDDGQERNYCMGVLKGLGYCDPSMFRVSLSFNL